MLEMSTKIISIEVCSFMVNMSHYLLNIFLPYVCGDVCLPQCSWAQLGCFAHIWIPRCSIHYLGPKIQNVKSRGDKSRDYEDQWWMVLSFDAQYWHLLVWKLKTNHFSCDIMTLSGTILLQESTKKCELSILIPSLACMPSTWDSSS